jgi:predicted ester cyclase
MPTAVRTTIIEREGFTMAGETIRNQQLVREFIRSVFDEHDAGAVLKCFSAAAQWHGGSLGTLSGAAGIANLFSSFFSALPDLHATELGLASVDDTVWVRFTVEGTNRGSLFGQPPTNKKVKWEEVDIYRVVEGKIVEEWPSADLVNILHQIGAYTPPWISK